MPLKYLPKYSETFIETGTLNGAGVMRALESGYNKVKSIELDDNLCTIAQNIFRDDKRVEIVRGDSGLVLGEVIKNIDSQITFFLDGHYSGPGTAYGIHEYPLLPELKHIKDHNIKNHIILIDDLRLWKNYDDQLNLETVINLISTINKEYEFFTMEGHVQDDILVCKIK